MRFSRPRNLQARVSNSSTSRVAPARWRNIAVLEVVRSHRGAPPHGRRRRWACATSASVSSASNTSGASRTGRPAAKREPPTRAARFVHDRESSAPPRFSPTRQWRRAERAEYQCGRFDGRTDHDRRLGGRAPPRRAPPERPVFLDRSGRPALGAAWPGHRCLRRGAFTPAPRRRFRAGSSASNASGPDYRGALRQLVGVEGRPSRARLSATRGRQCGVAFLRRPLRRRRVDGAGADESMGRSRFGSGRSATRGPAAPGPSTAGFHQRS